MRLAEAEDPSNRWRQSRCSKQVGDRLSKETVVGSMKQSDDLESIRVVMREPVGVFRYMTGESKNGVVEQG